MSRTTALILALDIGTSSTRALLYDTSGRLQPDREVAIKYAMQLTDGGGVQTDPAILLRNTISSLKKLIFSCTKDERNRVEAVAISCFWHSLLGVDQNGDAVTPLYSWADTRSQIVAPALRKLLKPDDYHKRTGAFIHSSYWPAKITWLRQTQPEIVDKVATWLSFSDYLSLKLSENYQTSVSMASGTGLFNQVACKWDTEICEKLEISSKQLPPIADGSTSFRAISSGLGITKMPDVPWFPAFGDGVCSNIGAGGTTKERIVINVGTSGAIRVLTDQPSPTDANGLFQYRLDKRRFLIGGAVSNGGNIWAWLNRTLKTGNTPDELESTLMKTSPDQHGLTVLPFWAGERSPGWRTDTTATITGLTLASTGEDIAQASLESIAYVFVELRDQLQAVIPDSKQIIISGGGVKGSRYMQHLLADTLDCPVRVSLDSEPSGRGAAIAVSEILGYRQIDHAIDRLSKPIPPLPSSAEVYRSGLERYRKLYNQTL